MKPIFTLVAGLVSLGFSFGAEAKGYLNSDLSQFESSDNMKYSQLSFSVFSEAWDSYWPFPHQRSPSWGLKANHINGTLTDSYEFQGDELVLFYGRKIDENSSFVFEIGGHQVRDDLKLQSQHIIFNGELHFSEHSPYKWSLEVGERFLYPSVLPLSGNPGDLKARLIQPKLIWEYSPSTKVQLKYQSARFKYGGGRDLSDAQILWGIQTAPHWVWLGAGVERVQNFNSDGSYYSPNDFYALGLRLDGLWHLTGKLSCFVGGSLNQMQEVGLNSGSGHFIRTGLQWGERESVLIRLATENTSSFQSSSRWSSQLLGLNVQYLW